MNSYRSRDMVELKKQALEYYSVNSDIPKKMEEALNSLFYESPYDAYGYLSEYFQYHSKPAFISRIVATNHLLLDPKSQPTFRVDLFCQERNKEIKIISLECPCYSTDVVNDSAKIQTIQEDDNLRHTKLEEIRHLINTEINSLIKNHSPFDQDEIDEKLRKLFQNKQAKWLEFTEENLNPRKITASQQTDSFDDDKSTKSATSPKQKSIKNTARKPSQGVHALPHEDNAISAVHSHYYPSFLQAFISKLICLSSLTISKKQLFEHICDLNSKKIDKFSMPIPMITVLQNGKGFNGKQNLIKEFILMPKAHISVQKGIELISKINRHIRDTLYQSKQQPGSVNKCITENGSLTCSLDTVQQGLELIENAITTVCGPDNSINDLSLVLNVSASEIFDFEKNKYEVTNGGLKSSDELIELYSDLITKYPRIVMLIEPFIFSDHLAWYKLYLKISKYCLIANNIKVNDNFDKNELNKNERGDEKTTELISKETKIMEQLNPESLKMPVNFYKFENMITLSSLNQNFGENERRNLYNGISCSFNETSDSFISDLSVSNQVKFIRIGGLYRSERVAKINRLIEIEQYLDENQMLNDVKGVSREIKFVADFEIPAKYIEAIQSLEDNKKTIKTK